MANFFHNVGPWTCHLMPQTIPHLLYSLFVPHHLESVQTRVSLGLASAVLLGPSHFPVYYKSWKCSLLLFWNCTVPDICLPLYSQMWVVVALAAWSWHFTLVWLCWPGYLPLWLSLLLPWELEFSLLLLPFHALFSCLFHLCFLVTAFCKSAFIVYLTLPCVRLLALYFWHHVMLHSRMITPLVASDYIMYSMCFVWLLYVTVY